MRIVFAEEVGFQRSFEGGSRINVADLDWKGVPHHGSGIRKSTLTKLSSADFRNSKYTGVIRRAELSRWRIDRQKIRDVDRRCVGEEIVTEDR